jgi:hypothetical protein
MDFVISYGENSFMITASSIIETKIISPDSALNCLYLANKDLFSNLSLSGNFDAEIHIRLLSESEKCYYYIGVVNKTGKIFAYLLNAENGEIIASKEINYKTHLAV